MPDQRPAPRVPPVRRTARRPVPRRDHMRITSAADRREHRVPEVDYAEAIVRATGECVARCGHPVVMSALATPPGTPCRVCADVVPDERTW